MVVGGFKEENHVEDSKSDFEAEEYFLLESNQGFKVTLIFNEERTKRKHKKLAPSGGSKTTLEQLLKETPDTTNKANPRTTLISESGIWMHALFSSNLDTLWNDNSLWMTVAFWLGCNVCEPH
ncbi:hypothetical protein EVAR_38717_1 [Eumeta japonica]|uniref:Uncharacterized protein n=1 Tax=Eumeta variegata TaxID=151549 RepID=A0A4C1XM86_EUMVA|nr:hypothetical protein EVAR_38717_1 [Eumeta japonica]